MVLILSDNTPADSSDNPREDLLEPISIPGTTGLTAKRVFIEFVSDTDIYDADGSVKTAFFVPDFLLQEPSSLPLKGDETKDLGASENIFEEYLWLLKINAPGTDVESRTVEIYRLIKAKCDDKSGGPAVECTDASADVSDRSHVAALAYLQLR